MAKFLVNSPNIRGVVCLLAPIIMIVALYVQFHGEEGPGGGFQAGAIMASVILLYASVFGAQKVSIIIKEELLIMLASAGVLIYIFIGLLPVIFDYSVFLDYSLCNFFPEKKNCFSIGQSLGAFFIEIGVGITVFSSLSIFVLKFLSLVNHEFSYRVRNK